MQSLFTAVSDFLAGILYGHYKVNTIVATPIPKVEENWPPVGYRSLYFNCWLCQGSTKFACKPLKENEKKYTIECSWCGVENVVTVVTNQQK